MAYAGPEFFLGGMAGVTFNKIAEKAKRDRGNVQEQVVKAIRNGEPLTPKLERALFEALCAIHEEARLHTYPGRIMSALRTLRICEDAARFQIAELDKESPPQQIESAFLGSVCKVTDPFREALTTGLRLTEKSKLDNDERVTVYFAGAIFHTLVEIWEEAATSMSQSAALMSQSGPLHPDDQILDFEHLGIPGIHSVLDIAEKSFDLYEDIDTELSRLSWSPRADDNLRRLIDQDRQIAGINMASLASYGTDWTRAEMHFLKCFGLDRAEIISRAQALGGRGQIPLNRSVALLETHPNHMLLARNLLYFALQQRNESIEMKVRDHIAATLTISPDDIYAVSLAGRKPLFDEPHLNLSRDHHVFNTEER